MDEDEGRGETEVTEVDAMRAVSRRIACGQAEQLRLVVRVAERCTREARALLRVGRRVPGSRPRPS